MADLLELAARIEAASEPGEELDQAICLALYPDYALPPAARCVPTHIQSILPRYSASLDAAMTLVPEGWNWHTGARHHQHDAIACVENGQSAFVGVGTRKNPVRLWFDVVAATPALALVSAALRAHASQEQSA